MNTWEVWDTVSQRLVMRGSEREARSTLESLRRCSPGARFEIVDSGEPLDTSNMWPWYEHVLFQAIMTAPLLLITLGLLTLALLASYGLDLWSLLHGLGIGAATWAGWALMAGTVCWFSERTGLL